MRTFFQFVILVVDSTDRERLSISRDELHKMLGHEELSKANILVFANKQVALLLPLSLSMVFFLILNASSATLTWPSTSLQDVKGCMTAAEISKQLNLQSMRKHKWQIQACCALSGEG